MALSHQGIPTQKVQLSERFMVLGEFIGKIMESQQVGIFPIIEKIIDMGRRLPLIIGNVKEFSAKY